MWTQMESCKIKVENKDLKNSKCERIWEFREQISVPGVLWRTFSGEGGLCTGRGVSCRIGTPHQQKDCSTVSYGVWWRRGAPGREEDTQCQVGDSEFLYKLGWQGLSPTETGWETLRINLRPCPQHLMAPPRAQTAESFHSQELVPQSEADEIRGQGRSVEKEHLESVHQDGGPSLWTKQKAIWPAFQSCSI